MDGRGRPGPERRPEALWCSEPGAVVTKSAALTIWHPTARRTGGVLAELGIARPWPADTPLAAGKWTTVAGAKLAKTPSGSLTAFNGLIGKYRYQAGDPDERWSFAVDGGTLTCGCRPATRSPGPRWAATPGNRQNSRTGAPMWHPGITKTSSTPGSPSPASLIVPGQATAVVLGRDGPRHHPGTGPGVDTQRYATEFASLIRSPRTTHGTHFRDRGIPYAELRYWIAHSRFEPAAFIDCDSATGGRDSWSAVGSERQPLGSWR